MSKSSEAQKRASQKWNSKQSRLEIKMSPELREKIDNHAKKMNESTTKFLIRSALNQIEKDNEKFNWIFYIDIFNVYSLIEYT